MNIFPLEATPLPCTLFSTFNSNNMVDMQT